MIEFWIVSLLPVWTIFTHAGQIYTQLGWCNLIDCFTSMPCNWSGVTYMYGTVEITVFLCILEKIQYA